MYNKDTDVENPNFDVEKSFREMLDLKEKNLRELSKPVPFFLKPLFMLFIFIFLLFLLFIYPVFILSIIIIIGITLLVIRSNQTKKQFQRYNEIINLSEKIFNAMYFELKLYKSNLHNDVISATDKIDSQNKTIDFNYSLISELKTSITVLEAEKDTLQTETEVIHYDYSSYDALSSQDCKNEIALSKQIEKRYTVDEYTDSYNILTKAENTNNYKKICRIFNAEVDNCLLNLSVNTINTCRKKITKSFETINKLFEKDNLQIPHEVLEVKLEILNLVYTYEKKKEEETKQRIYIREQLLEEEKVRKEIEREKLKIQKEESQFNNEVIKLMQYMQKTNSDIEKNLYADKIRELEDKLKLLEEDKKNVFERETNTRAGFVYIISNLGAFGENVYKIGMTRRLEPMDRIKELSSASVPFSFDVHALIFSHDAPALESSLHKRFRNYEVNKVNSRKEFFNMDLNKIENAVLEFHNATVIFDHYPVAKEWRESLEIIS